MKSLKIEIKAEDGKIDKIKDESENEPTELTMEEALKIEKSGTPVARIFHAHHSPGCVYVITSSGRAVKVCS